MKTPNPSSDLIQAVFRVHGIGQSKEDEELTQEMIDNHGIDARSIAAVKKLFTEQLKPFRTAAGKARAYHLSRTFEGFGTSRLLVVAEQEAYTAKMESLIEEIHKAKAAFIANYPAHIELERKLKGDAFRGDDYPPAEKLSGLFRVTFLFCPIAEPNDAVLKQLGVKHAEQYEKALKAATDKVRRDTLGMMMTLIAQTAESLAGDGPIVDDDNRKGPLAKLREYLERVPKLNITADPTISALAEECRKRLDVSTEALRGSKMFRKQVAGVATEIAQRFGAMGARKLAA
jgi:hypothetical protein